MATITLTVPDENLEKLSKLIAAAPDLLEACKAAMGVLDGLAPMLQGEGAWGWAASASDALAACQESIKQVEGN